MKTIKVKTANGWRRRYPKKPKRTMCQYGRHPKTPENTVVYNGQPRCLLCKRAASREYQRRMRQRKWIERTLNLHKPVRVLLLKGRQQ